MLTTFSIYQIEQNKYISKISILELILFPVIWFPNSIMKIKSDYPFSNLNKYQYMSKYKL